MKAILILTVLTIYAKGVISNMYFVKTKATEGSETNEGVEDDAMKEIIFNNWNDEVKKGEDYAATPVIDYEEGSDVKLKCPSPINFQDCQFKAPSGKTHKIGITGKPYKFGRVKSLHGVSTKILLITFLMK